MSDFDSPRHPIDDLAQVIRRYPNRVDTKTLADSIAAHLDDGKPCGGCGDVVAAIIDRINPDRRWKPDYPPIVVADLPECKACARALTKLEASRG